MSKRKIANSIPLMQMLLNFSNGKQKFCRLMWVRLPRLEQFMGAKTMMYRHENFWTNFDNNTSHGFMSLSYMNVKCPFSTGSFAVHNFLHASNFVDWDRCDKYVSTEQTSRYQEVWIGVFHEKYIYILLCMTEILSFIINDNCGDNLNITH